MSAYTDRIEQDLIKIRDLSASTGNRVRIASTQGNPVNKINLLLDYKTAPSDSYPSKSQNTTEVRIELLSRYPFQEPNATGAKASG